MPRYIEKKILPFSHVELFNLVTDVENYPEFLPWCEAVRIIEQAENCFTAAMVVGYKNISEQYISKVVCTPPVSNSAEIKVSMVRGPFRHLFNNWHFKYLSDKETEVLFEIDFSFKSAILEKMIKVIFDKAAKKIVKAFEDRAATLHNNFKT